jgi:hypothetical protein
MEKEGQEMSNLLTSYRKVVWRRRVKKEGSVVREL